MGNLNLSLLSGIIVGAFCPGIFLFYTYRENIMRSSNIGGQAVMEGIMMRHKDKYSIAVRRPDKEIELKVEDYKCIFGNGKIWKKPIIRGVVSFVESLVIGTKCRMFSAEIAGDEEEEEEAKKVNDAKKNGGRVICVGTTSCRTVESATGEDGILKAGSGWTDIFIYPGYRFKILDGLITNFHLPESTLVMLVSALAGRDHVLHAYEEAIKEKYRFFSFGDATLIIDNIHDHR